MAGPTNPKRDGEGGVAVPPDVWLADLENRLETLRVHFEQFFLGFEKKSPMPVLDVYERDMRRATLVRLANTQARFRFQKLLLRYRLLQGMWERGMRQAEQGLFRPGAEARQRLSVTAGVSLPASLGDPTEESAEAVHPAADREHPPVVKPRPVEETRAIAAAAAEALNALSGGAQTARQRYDALYGEFVAARHLTREPVEGLTAERFAETVERQRAAIEQRLRGLPYEMVVVVKEGRATLSARPVVRNLPGEAPLHTQVVPVISPRRAPAQGEAEER